MSFDKEQITALQEAGLSDSQIEDADTRAQVNTARDDLSNWLIDHADLRESLPKVFTAADSALAEIDKAIAAEGDDKGEDEAKEAGEVEA